MPRELLFSVTKKDFEIQPYKGSGKGGQHRNKTMSCIRMRHPESGAQVIATEHREQHRNRVLAFQRMVKNPVFNAWRRQKARDIARGKDLEKEINEKVEKAMRPENIKVEIYNTKTKRWEPEHESSKELSARDHRRDNEGQERAR